MKTDATGKKKVLITIGRKQLPLTDSSLGIGSMFEKFVAFVPYLQLSRITHKPKKEVNLNLQRIVKY